MPIQHHVKMPVIHIGDPKPALTKQTPFALCIFLKTGMLVGTDVIRGQIGENTDLKGNPRRPVHHKTLGRDFHDADLAARLHHLRKILLDQTGFRRGIVRRNVSFSNDRLNGSDQPHLIPRML